MAATDNRPFFLNLIKIRLPVTGMVSILHRISGFLLFLAIPFVVYLLDISLQGDNGFKQATELLQHPFVTLILLVLLWSIIHHFFAGIRFLLLDFDIGVEKQPAIRFAWAVFILEAITFVVFAVGICL